MTGTRQHNKPKMRMLLCGNGNTVPEVLSQWLGPISKNCEPAGHAYFDYCLERWTKDTNQDEKETGSECSDDFDNDDLIKKETAEFVMFLQKLKPGNAKKQDPYVLLGLDDLRYKASENLIKKAYKAKAVVHHPDKRKQRGEIIENEDGDYFNCIKLAYNLLKEKKSRQAFDSVDPTFDDTVPKALKKQNSENFYSLFGKYFEINSRFSIRSPVPKLGNDDSSCDDVMEFYDFWNNFQSWREFSNMKSDEDLEEEKNAESREERRYLERKNNKMCKQKKLEDNGRIQRLVDNAFDSDPRIKKFKEEEKKRKQEIKMARNATKPINKTILIEQEDLKKKEQEKLEKEKAEAEEKIKRAQEKKQKENQKKALKKHIKQLTTLIKDKNYYSDGDKDIELTHIIQLDKILGQLSLDGLKDFIKEIEEGAYEVGREAFFSHLSKLSA